MMKVVRLSCCTSTSQEMNEECTRLHLGRRSSCRRDSYIQDLNIPGKNEPSTMHIFHRTRLCNITAVRRAYSTPWHVPSQRHGRWQPMELAVAIHGRSPWQPTGHGNPRVAWQPAGCHAHCHGMPLKSQIICIRGGKGMRPNLSF